MNSLMPRRWRRLAAGVFSAGLSTATATALALAIAPALSVTGCVEQSSDGPSEEDVKAAREHVLQTAPTPKHPSGAVLTAPQGQGQGRLTYLGLDIDTDTVAPGKAFTLTHYFRVEQPVAEGWRLFVHLDGPPGGRVHLNADHVPVGGKYPIPMWKKGEIIRDIHRVSVPQGWTADKLHLYIGIWKGQARFKVESGTQDGQNRVQAAILPVSGVAGPAASGSSASAPSDDAAGLKRLIARRLPAGTEMKIDGKLDEPAWKDAPSTGPFVGTMNGGPAEQAAQARVLWDDANVYVAFEFADKDVWTSLAKHDDKLWTQEAAEVFIDADGDGKTYVELQVNPRNATFDSWLPAYRQNDNAWDAEGLKTAVSVDGTLDKRDDTDKGWVVEMAIPVAAVKGRLQEVAGVPPKVGARWRVNFFRMDMPAGKAQTASGWSPPLRPDFHALDRFGVLLFGDEKGQVPQPAATDSAGPAGGPHPVSPMIRKLIAAEPKLPPVDPRSVPALPLPPKAKKKPAAGAATPAAPATPATKEAP